MPRLSAILLLLLCAAPLRAVASVDLKTRLLVGEVQYLAQQHKYFDALLHIDDVQVISQQKLRRAMEQLRRDAEQGEYDRPVLSLADIELGYRMSQRAGSAIRAVLGENISQQQRNQAAFRLAKIYYDKQQYDYAQYALQLIRGELFYPFSHDVKYLQAKIHARSGEFDGAIAIFEKLQYDDRFRGFAAYNLAHTLMANGQLQAGLEKLAQVGDMDAHREPLQSLRDKANLMLGYKALQNNSPRESLMHLKKVRLQSAFASKALLGIAWANMTLQNYQGAITAWTELQSRDATHAAVREAWLGLPYSYGKLGAYSKAIELYESAISNYETSLAGIQEAIDRVASGELFQQLGERNAPTTEEDILRLRELAPMAYLDELLAQPAFQLAVKNLMDLNAMQSRLQQWRRTVVSLKSLVEQREQFAKKVTRKLNNDLDAVDAQLARLKLQYDTLVDLLASIAPDNNLQLLADRGEQIVLASLQRIRLASETQPQDENLLRRIRRARGVIDWRLAQQYRQRRNALATELERAHVRLQALQAKRSKVTQKLHRAEKVAAYKVPLFNIDKQIVALDDRLQAVAAEQQDSLQAMMLQALEKRQALVKQYLTTARYELAKSYDLVLERERRQSTSTDENAAAP